MSYNLKKSLAEAEVVPTQEMIDWFEERTRKHIERVQKMAKRLEEADPSLKGLVEQTADHDASKFEEPERLPYIFISWQYRCKDLGIDFTPPAQIKEWMSKATEHHVKSNRHHPEFHCSDEVGLINREDRDKPPSKLIDGSKMSRIDVAEMVADWLGMAEEKGTKAKDWADKNVNVRWSFSDEQVADIYRLIAQIEGKAHE